MVPSLDDCAESGEKERRLLRFDVITALDVIEHTADPGEFVRNVDRILNPAGFFLLVTGDLDSFSARFAGGRWLYFHRDEHLSFLSEQAVTGLLRPLGYSLLAKTWVQSTNIDRASVAWLVKAVCKELAFKMMPKALVRRVEARIDTRFSCFLGNMLLLFQKGGRAVVDV